MNNFASFIFEKSQNFLSQGTSRGIIGYTGVMRFYHGDHLGSTNIVTDSDGNLVEWSSYYPFGDAKSGGMESKYLYTGKEKEDIGLYYYGARYYMSRIRRWTQADMIIPDVYDPQSLNRYSYVRNNPVKYTDPEGRAWWLMPFAIGYTFGSYKGLFEYAAECDRQGKPFNEEEARLRSTLEGGEWGGKATLWTYMKAQSFLRKLSFITGLALMKINIYLYGQEDVNSEVAYESTKIFINEVVPFLIASKFIDTTYNDLPLAVKTSLIENPEFRKLVVDIGGTAVEELTECQLEKLDSIITQELGEYEKSRDKDISNEQ